MDEWKGRELGDEQPTIVSRDDLVVGLEGKKIKVASGSVSSNPFAKEQDENVRKQSMNEYPEKKAGKVSTNPFARHYTVLQKTKEIDSKKPREKPTKSVQHSKEFLDKIAGLVGKERQVTIKVEREPERTFEQQQEYLNTMVLSKPNAPKRRHRKNLH